MNKEEVIYYLKNENLNKALWLEAKRLRQNMIELQEEREQIKDELYYSLQTTVRVNDMPVISSKGNHSDLNDIIEATHKQINAAEKEYTTCYSKVMEQLDEHRRVHLAVATLLPLERTIITLHFFNDLTYKAIENELNIDHKDLYYALQKALDHIVEKVNSELSNEQLAKLKNTSKLMRKPKKQKKKDMNGQMNVLEFLQGEGAET